MKEQKILILSRADDEHVERLVTELDLLGHPWIRFDPGDFPATAELSVCLGQRSGCGQLVFPGGNSASSFCAYPPLPASVRGH